MPFTSPTQGAFRAATHLEGVFFTALQRIGKTQPEDNRMKNRITLAENIDHMSGLIDLANVAEEILAKSEGHIEATMAKRLESALGAVRFGSGSETLRLVEKENEGAEST